MKTFNHWIVNDSTVICYSEVKKGVKFFEMKRSSLFMLIAGAIIGLIGVLLVKFGNPGNMGFCIVCFWRDIAGALGLHKAPPVQYIRPEIIGLIIGAFGISVFKRDFRPRGGSSAAIRFVMAVFMAIGGLVFLGCPLRMLLRLGNGDLNAVVGLAGFVCGILVGIQFLKHGYTLGRNHTQPAANGWIMPAFAVALLVFLIVRPAFIAFSAEGPGSMHAAVALSLAAGLIVGGLLQRTRICSAGAIRDVILIRDMHFMWGVIGILIAAILGNIFITGSFHIGFDKQPIAHSMHLWNFLGLGLVGLTGVLVGGCPIRQTVLSAEGDIDAIITVFGLIVGTAFAHNFGLAASGEGVPVNGQIAVIIGYVVVLAIAGLVTMQANKGGA